ncbi:hypothetical protein J2805_003848 [Arthrobacter oryzae]|nr:hypothetical protein [Arthrobacter oryzae]
MRFCLQLSTESKLALPLEGSGDLFTDNGSACRSPPTLGPCGGVAFVCFESGLCIGTSTSARPIGSHDKKDRSDWSTVTTEDSGRISLSCDFVGHWQVRPQRSVACLVPRDKALCLAPQGSSWGLLPNKLGRAVFLHVRDHPYPASGTCRCTGRVGSGIDLNPPRTQVSESLQTCSAHAQLSSYSWPIRYECHQVKFCVSCPPALCSGRTKAADLG